MNHLLKGLFFGVFLTFLLGCSSVDSVSEEGFIENTSDEISSIEEGVVSQENFSEQSVLPVVEEEEIVRWEYDMDREEWVSFGSLSVCAEPFTFPSPVDVSLASSVLYPGQLRSGDYKPHGGFRFDTLGTNAVDIYAPFDAWLYQAARHLESGEVQYSLYFYTGCGMSYKLDHLRTLTPEYETLLEDIPLGAEGDSRTTFFSPLVFVPAGEHIATEIGIIEGQNVFFDFGVYDLREKNGVVYDASFREQQVNVGQYGAYAICWFDSLEGGDSEIVWALPPGDSVSGSESDYCY